MLTCCSSRVDDLACRDHTYDVQYKASLFVFQISAYRVRLSFFKNDDSEDVGPGLEVDGRRELIFSIGLLYEILVPDDPAWVFFGSEKKKVKWAVSLLS